jgi:hypothetical protein
VPEHPKPAAIMRGRAGGGVSAETCSRKRGLARITAV